MKQVQQGDVLFLAVEAVKGKEVKPDERGYVFVEGETTGHCHAIKDTEAVKVYEENGVKYVRVIAEKAVVEHQEHAPVVLPRGNYKIGIVQEYDWFADEIRSVKD
jgi:hypothetical protein